jgi:hypothetical protein
VPGMMKAVREAGGLEVLKIEHLPISAAAPD